MSASLILLSGGLDSVANLAFESQKKANLKCLFFDYGQKAAEQEKKAALFFAHRYSAPLIKLNLDFFTRFTSSALTDCEQALPKNEMSESSAKQVWVPNRNGVFLNLAAALAENEGFNQIWVGLNQEEAQTFPDNSELFLNQINGSLKVSTKAGVQVASHTVHLTKKQIVEKLMKIDPKFPFESLWSCYDRGPRPCESCESCLRLTRAIDASSG